MDRIARSHPLAAGLTAAVLPRSIRTQDLVTGAETSRSGTVNVVGTQRGGYAFEASGGAGSMFTNYAPGYCQGLKQFSVVMFAEASALPTAGNQGYFFGQSTNPTGGFVGLGILLANGALGATGTKWTVSIRPDGATRTNVNGGAGGTAVQLGVPYCIGFVYDAVAGVARLYVNGALEGSVSSAFPTFQSGNPAATTRFMAYADSTLPGSGKMGGFYVWNRVLSANEMGLMYARPEVLVTPSRAMLAQVAASFKPAWARGANRFVGWGLHAA